MGKDTAITVEEKKEKVQDFRPIDDAFFEVLANDIDFCQEMLQILLVDDELTVEEQTERMEEITEKFTLLGIPVIIDRSADEKTELAQYEWIKVYGVLFGCEEKMDKMFEEAVDEAGVQENQ